jgi:hypothetical protein
MVMACRGGRPLLVVDVALPRDIDPGVREVNDVTLLDLDDLKDYARRSAERRRGEIGKVREILAAEIDRYRADRSGREVAPLVTALRARAEDVRRASSSAASAARLDPRARGVEALTQRHRQQAVCTSRPSAQGRRPATPRGESVRRRSRAVRARRPPRSTTTSMPRLRVATRGQRARALAGRAVGQLLGWPTGVGRVVTTGDRDRHARSTRWAARACS